MIHYRQPFTGYWPITLDFGEEWLPTYKKGEHKGIDYGLPEGTPVLASADGTVIRTGYAVTGYGKFVIIQHEDGSGTVYAHLKQVTIADYAKVKQGDVIGLSGNTGNSTGPHLHFEWRRVASRIDTVEDPKTKLQSVLDKDPDIYTPGPVKPQFEAVHDGYCIVVCDVANVRCHCDMTRIIGQRKKGDIIAIGDEVTMYNGLPYRDYYDAEKKCWLRIAEHDPYDQIIVNYDLNLNKTVRFDGTRADS